jgi:SAM-dependent methyltransferase
MFIRLIRDIWKSRVTMNSPVSGDGGPSANYSAELFDAGDLETAKVVILNAAPDMTTAERWEIETERVAREFGRTMMLDRDSRVLDFGCGVGRISKALIERYGCSVVGVDISADMRRLAREYVKSERFVACDPEALERMVAEGFSATHACACWVLQHCEDPGEDIARIESALAPGGHFFVLNSNHRWVPTDRGWAADSISVEDLLRARFDSVAKTGVSNLVVSPTVAGQSYAMLLRKKV